MPASYPTTLNLGNHYQVNSTASGSVIIGLKRNRSREGEARAAFPLFSGDSRALDFTKVHSMQLNHFRSSSASGLLSRNAHELLNLHFLDLCIHRTHTSLSPCDHP